MKLSIIIPVYNAEKTLEATVDSLLRCGLSDYEILLVDDGSARQTARLCDALAAGIPQLRCIHQPNGGVSAARNRGLEEALGDYLWFFDADDTVDPDSMAEAEGLLETHRPDMLLFGMRFDYYRRGLNYRSELAVYPRSGLLARSAWQAEIPALFHANYLSPVWNKLIRRSLLTENGLRFSRELFLFEDLDFSLRCLRFCGDVYCWDRPIYRYRQPEDEGNAGRRLRRLERISGLCARLEQSFLGLAADGGGKDEAFDALPTEIFLMLARQKVQVSRLREIGPVCDDLKDWVSERSLPAALFSGKYAQALLGRRVLWLYGRSRYSGLRHRASVRVKYWRRRLRKRETS